MLRKIGMVLTIVAVFYVASVVLANADQEQINALHKHVDSLAERACLNEKLIQDLQFQNSDIMKLLDDLRARQSDASSPETKSLEDRLARNNAKIDYLREQIKNMDIQKVECADPGTERTAQEAACENGASQEGGCKNRCETCFEGTCFALMCPGGAERQRWEDQYRAQPTLVLPQEKLWSAAATQGSNSILDHVPMLP